MTKNLYSVKSSSEGYEIAKFDLDLNVESSYSVSLSECECPQGHKPTCRHRKMLPLFLEAFRVDTTYFLDFDTKTWHLPLDPQSGAVEYHTDVIKRLDAAQREASKGNLAHPPQAPTTPDGAPLEAPPTAAVRPSWRRTL